LSPGAFLVVGVGGERGKLLDDEEIQMQATDLLACDEVVGEAVEVGKQTGFAAD
jgi:hypothetical protein